MQEAFHPLRQIRAVYDANTIRVYQAFGDEIADIALSRQTLVSPPFKMGRMTWIKPSFLWMMYRAGWGLKDAHQKRILAIDISRDGFEWALLNSCLTHRPPELSELEWNARKSEAPVRVQWDPERDLLLRPLQHRSIQIGLCEKAVEHYVHDWIKGITDVSDRALTIEALVRSENLEEAECHLPRERPYPLDASIGRLIDASA